MMSDDNSEDDKVGKGKPPKKHQFKPGQSGNPKGRPKGSKNIHHVLTKILGEKITITEAGKKKVVTKLEGALRVMVMKAFEGHPLSLRLLLDVLAAASKASPEATENPFTDEDYKALMAELDWLEIVRDAHAGRSNDT